MNCSWCQQLILRELSFQEILFPFTLKKTLRCKNCNDRLEKISEDTGCKCCGKVGLAKICNDCQYWQKKYPEYAFRHFALYHYNKGFQEWIYQYKFLGDLRLKNTFADEIHSFFKKHSVDFIVPIPLSEKRFSERGFNQTAEFLKGAGKTISPFLIRSLHLKAQSEQSREQRLAMSQPLVIADDVYTTGRTLFHAAELLRSYQPKQILTFSIAR